MQTIYTKTTALSNRTYSGVKEAMCDPVHIFAGAPHIWLQSYKLSTGVVDAI